MNQVIPRYEILKEIKIAVCGGSTFVCRIDERLLNLWLYISKTWHLTVVVQHIFWSVHPHHLQLSLLEQSSYSEHRYTTTNHLLLWNEKCNIVQVHKMLKVHCSYSMSCNWIVAKIHWNIILSISYRWPTISYQYVVQVTSLQVILYFVIVHIQNSTAELVR